MDIEMESKDVVSELFKSVDVKMFRLVSSIEGSAARLLQVWQLKKVCCAGMFAKIHFL